MNEQETPLEQIYKNVPPKGIQAKKRFSSPNPITNKPNPSPDSISNETSPRNNSNNDIRYNLPNQIKRRQGEFLGPKQLIQRNSTIHLTIEKTKPVPSLAQPQLDKLINAKIKSVIASHCYSIYIIILTFIYWIYDDLREICFNAKYDDWIDAFLYIIMLLLLFDFICSIVFANDYLLSSFCIYEVIACITMIFEVDRVLLLLPLGNNSNRTSASISITVTNQNGLLLITRIVKLVKLLRIAKVYKAFFGLIRAREVNQLIKNAKEKMSKQKSKQARKMKHRLIKTIKQGESNAIISNKVNHNGIIDSIPSSNNQMIVNHYDTNNNDVQLSQIGQLNHRHILKSQPITSHKIININGNGINYQSNTVVDVKEGPVISIEDYSESKVSQQISDSTITKMVIIIFLIYFINIIIDEDLYTKNPSSYSLLVKYLKAIQSLSSTNTTNFFADPKIFIHWLIDNITEASFYPIISITYSNTSIFTNTSLSTNSNAYRYDEIGFIYDNTSNTAIAFSMQKEAKLTSIANIARTIYLTIILFILSFLINEDGKKFILAPLNKMISVVNIVSKDPVNSKTLYQLKAEIDSNIKSKAKKNKDSDRLDAETKTIQMAIIRICSLMAIGFGEAGGEILKENISSNENLNPMLQGKRVQAIFGFCFIRRFAEINEALQERTMVFVNQISDIVHSSVDKFCGISNKNIGDCFLLVWKFNSQSLHEEETELKTVLPREDKISFYADSAVLSYLNIIKKINKSQLVLAYKRDPALIAKFGDRFSIQMGFGLHFGWGIEGAIGSFYKIDCSYLSPNVNIAARLETATNIYGVDILLSGELYGLLSEFMKNKCREIDIVTLKGSETPVRLYTVDVNKNIQPGKAKNKKTRMSLREKRLYYFNKKKRLLHRYDLQCKTKTILEVYLKVSKGMRQLLNLKRSELFVSYFDEGFTSYINGDWEDAYNHLAKALYLNKNDGPTKTLMEYIKVNNAKAPIDWDGYRVLSSKS